MLCGIEDGMGVYALKRTGFCIARAKARRPKAPKLVDFLLGESVFSVDGWEPKLARVIFDGLLESLVGLDRFETVERACLDGDQDQEPSARSVVTKWKPVARTVLDSRHAGVADSRFRVPVVLEIVKNAPAIFFECTLCVGVFASQRGQRLPG